MKIKVKDNIVRRVSVDPHFIIRVCIDDDDDQDIGFNVYPKDEQSLIEELKKIDSLPNGWNNLDDAKGVVIDGCHLEDLLNHNEFDEVEWRFNGINGRYWVEYQDARGYIREVEILTNE